MNAAIENIYSVEHGSVDDHATMLDIWHGTFGDDGAFGRKLQWYYAESAIGMPLVRLLRHVPSGAFIGVASAAPRRMLWQGREIRAGVLADLAVVSDHRSLGPALLLARSMIDPSMSRFDLLYGFPNAKAQGVTGRAGHAKLADMDQCVCVLRYARYLAAHMPGALASALAVTLDAGYRLLRHLRSWTDPQLEVLWAKQADDRFDILWARSNHGSALVQVRDAAMARWRFDACPLAQTRYLLLSAPDSGELLAWFACRTEHSVLHVYDFWSLDAGTGIGSHFIRRLVVAAYHSGWHSVSFEFAGAASKTRGWTNAGFVKRRSRPVFGRWIHETSSGPLDVHLTSGDEDQ